MLPQSFVAPLAVRWQEWVDRMEKWEAGSVVSQRDFHSRFVLQHTSAGRKVLVVISDALRYEVGKELAQRIQAEERWSAPVQPMLGVLPSFTQLGMAALLPHKELSFTEGENNVLADGQPTGGTDSRDRILRAAHGGKAGAMLAKDFLALNSKNEGRELFRENEVIYVYHNAIDATGDKRDTEHETDVATERAITDVIKSLESRRDQLQFDAGHRRPRLSLPRSPVRDPDFLILEEPVPSEVLHRRFVSDTVVDSAGKLVAFTHAQLGLAGSGTITFPKGVQRLRQQGSGSRYVHGGLSLQEVVVPVIEVRKERTNEVTRVNVDVVRTATQITSSQVAVTFVQSEPVSERCLMLSLRVGFFSSRASSSVTQKSAFRFHRFRCSPA